MAVCPTNGISLPSGLDAAELAATVYGNNGSDIAFTSLRYVYACQVFICQ
jgi:hypothetical protein